MRTELARNLDTAGKSVQYDLQCKKILGNKWILALLMKALISEYSQAPVAEIIKCIEGEPEIGTVKMAPGETNPLNVEGRNTEDGVQGEGVIYFDIRFFAYLPWMSETKMIKIIVNVEAQKSFNPGYYIESRGIFYGSRMISAQFGTEFAAPHYNDIKKVYSIWICMNVPKYIGNAVSCYSFGKKDILPGIPDRKEAYDKICLIIVCLNEESEKQNNLTDMLNILFSTELGRDDKKAILEEKYKIPMDDGLGEEVNAMCNLSEYVEEVGFKRGRTETMEMVTRNFYNQGVPISVISAATGLTEKEIEALIGEKR